MGRRVRSTAGLGARLTGPPHGDQERAGNTAVNIGNNLRRTRVLQAWSVPLAMATPSCAESASRGMKADATTAATERRTPESRSDPIAADQYMTTFSWPPLLAIERMARGDNEACKQNVDAYRPDA